METNYLKKLKDPMCANTILYVRAGHFDVYQSRKKNVQGGLHTYQIINQGDAHSNTIFSSVTVL